MASRIQRSWRRYCGGASVGNVPGSAVEEAPRHSGTNARNEGLLTDVGVTGFTAPKIECYKRYDTKNNQESNYTAIPKIHRSSSVFIGGAESPVAQAVHLVLVLCTNISPVSTFVFISDRAPASGMTLESLRLRVAARQRAKERSLEGAGLGSSKTQDTQDTFTKTGQGRKANGTVDTTYDLLMERQEKVSITIELGGNNLLMVSSSQPILPPQDCVLGHMSHVFVSIR